MHEWAPAVPGLPVLDEIGALLAEAATTEPAAAGSRGRLLPPTLRRSSTRSLILAAALLVLAAASAGAGTLYLLRGSVIPAPAIRDVAPEQTPAAGTVAVSSLRVADTEPGQPAWTLRLAVSRTGFLCSTVGQVRDGVFGLVGLDGRFRPLAERIVDGCGQPRENAASLIGARVFDARSADDVRTAVNGIGGPKLRAVDITAGGRPAEVALDASGIFLAVLHGYPEDLGVTVALRFADGHVERHAFGTSAFVVADPLGGRAWKADAMAFGSSPGQPRNPQTCVRFRPARETRNPPTSPVACGVFPDPRHRTGVFFAARRITPGTGGIPIDITTGNWGSHPARTAIWGAAGEDVASIAVTPPGEAARDVAIAPNRAFLGLLDPGVDPGRVVVTATYQDGRRESHTGDTNLVDPPGRRP